MDLVKLIEQFADEDRCRDYLVKLRWPEGVRCPRCEGDKVKAIASKTYYRRDTQDGHKKGELRSKRHQFDCSCGYQFSVKSGTVLQDSHLPLWKWFLATYLLCESKKGMSANQLKRTLGVSYEAAWFLCHRIRSAMATEMTPLAGVIEIDETFIGGKAESGSKARGSRGGTASKTMIIGAFERGGDVRLKVAADGRTRVRRQFLKDVVSDEATAIYTDGHPAFRGLNDPRHETVDHSEEEWVRGDVTTNGVEGVWSLFKRSIVGSYHQLSVKHLPAYVDEFEFRFNNRQNPFLFRDTLIALLRGDVLTYDDLTAD